MGVGLLCGFDDFLFRGVGAAIGDVVPDRSGTEPGLLENHSVAAAKRLAGQIPNVAAVHYDGSGADVIEPHQQVDQRSLPAAGGADDGDALSRRYMQI